MRAAISLFLSSLMLVSSLAPAAAQTQRGAGHMVYSRSQRYIYWVTDSLNKQDAKDLAMSLCNGSESPSQIAQLRNVSKPKIGVFNMSNGKDETANLYHPASDCQDLGPFTSWDHNHVCGAAIFNRDLTLNRFVYASTSQKMRGKLNNSGLPWYFQCNDVASNGNANGTSHHDSGAAAGIAALIGLIGGIALASHHHSAPAPAATASPTNVAIGSNTAISFRNDTTATQSYSIKCSNVSSTLQYNIGSGATQQLDSSSFPGGPCSSFNVQVVNGGSASGLPGGGPYSIFTNANGHVTVSNIPVTSLTLGLTIVNDTRQDEDFTLTCNGASPQSFTVSASQTATPNMGCASGTFQLSDGSAVKNVTSGQTYHLQFNPSGALILVGP